MDGVEVVSDGLQGCSLLLAWTPRVASSRVRIRAGAGSIVAGFDFASVVAGGLICAALVQLGAAAIHDLFGVVLHVISLFLCFCEDLFSAI